MKRIDLDRDHLVALYEAGASTMEMAAEFGVSRDVICRRMKAAGLPPRGRKSVYDEDAAARRFLEGGSVKAVAQEFGIQRQTLVNMLRQRGIEPRGRRDAMLLRMAQSTPEERLRLTEAAHAAVRGRRQPEEHCIRQAQGRERTKSHASLEALALHQVLVETGIPATLEKAFGPYNLDIAFDELPIAVEIQGGNWHSHGRHGARLPKRREYILSSGWHLVEIWTAKRLALIPHAATEKLIALSQSLSLDPSGRGEHRVIGGNGDDLPALKSYGYDVPAIDAAERRCDRTGRYMSAA